jgi:hypothetical protein
VIWSAFVPSPTAREILLAIDAVSVTSTVSSFVVIGLSMSLLHAPNAIVSEIADATAYKFFFMMILRIFGEYSG